jgi:hypothetical protein
MSLEAPSYLLPGVYRITDPKGRSYIGSSLRPQRRWVQHRCELRKGRHHSPALQAVANKYGLEALEFVMLFNASADELEQAEQNLLDTLRPELNAIYQAGPGRMHRDPTYRENLKAALAEANRDPSYRERRIAANPQKKSVRCENDGRVFVSASAAAKEYGLTSGVVSACATGTTVQTKGGLVFRYVEAPALVRTSRLCKTPVRCIETGCEYPSVWEAAKAAGVTRGAINAAVKNGWRAGGYTWSKTTV